MKNLVKIKYDDIVFRANKKDVARLELIKKRLFDFQPFERFVTTDKINSLFIKMKEQGYKNSYLSNLKRILISAINQTIDNEIANFPDPENFNYYSFVRDYWRVFFKTIVIKTSRKTIEAEFPPDPEEILKIVKNMDNPIHSLMIVFILILGVRNSEIRNIKLSDIKRRAKAIKQTVNGEEKIVSIDLIYICSKNQNIRLLPVESEFIDLIIKAVKSKEYLFENPKGNKYGERNLQRIVSNGGRKTLNRRIYPHLIRHSLGTEFYDKIGDIIKGAQFMGNDPKTYANTYVNLRLSYENLKVVEPKPFMDAIEKKVGNL